MTAAEPIPFRLHLMLSINRAQQSGHFGLAAGIAGVLRQEIGVPASKPGKSLASSWASCPPSSSS